MAFTDGDSVASSSEKKKQLKRYQLTWKPSFSNTQSKLYVVGENLAVTDFASSESDLRNAGLDVQGILNLASTNTIMLPINTNIALGQEYSPSIKNKVVTYETVGGNSITTFGEAIRVIGLRIRIIRLSNEWELYYKTLEAFSYLSGNQSRYYGGLYLNGYDYFDNNRDFKLTNRYRVTISSLDFSFSSEQNTTVAADLKMFVNQDFSKSTRKWGRL